ncbi:MAG: MBL fold metallo-hydrolase [Rhodocyclaceae bacterium]|jgi:phosphoribosyl 1,2-cyclic phosphodiesterase|uniref:MBL fold metallo-hydrolase n=1 Tax=Candidatus Desulfobacillus denitrificans TaxID=2608985 RepID=A0A809R039_9PROT|nr:MBL fold metallo-hydrolase [Rhodocyclaceae bacterium]OQY69314.1 MAG: MBL fold metallo-hydrolase [Rhodocyclaceae bacterium UTPRO2]BBO21010.1 MBL fold metallo-hydrolase [Candidatus Desulfobacillus denitrificans]GIK45276.1 MAG: MBL fold metallo-hydrolase [Betaproteobacteria bacterium]GJQ53644.1 MAG: MBL fold metallo-hydrolase [Rhodocyclaceae bacterium]
MRFASLGSGSRGNALLVEAGDTRLLLDCGFGLRETDYRLGRLGQLPESLAGILVTHEHGDHIAGAFKLAARYRLRVWMTHGTHAAAPGEGGDNPHVELIDSHRSFSVGDLEIHPFPVPHDAREPVQYVFSDGRHRLGVVSDLGSSTPHVERMLSGCDALVLECNHDAAMLAQGNYPAQLKRRIAGRFGHLENAASAALLASLDTRNLQHLLAAHLSQQNNTPALARAALAGVLGCEENWIGVADQDAGFGWRALL